MEAKGPIYGIKLVTPDHFKYEFFEADFGDNDARSTLMNFKNTAHGISAARKLVPGSRAILYVSREQWFARLFEVIGTIEDGSRVAEYFNTPALDMYAPTNPYNIYLPIRWLARVEPDQREDPKAVCNRAAVDFRPNSYTFKQLSQSEYQRLYNSISWSWTRSQKSPPGSHDCLIEPANAIVEPRSPLKEVWYPQIVERIRHTASLPERNHEAVVSELLVHLGVRPQQIIFQQGRIDISVAGADGQVCLVIEVKQNLNITAQAARAREQAQIYGQRVGCAHCAITDGDLWELHDLGRGERYDQRYLGAFRLSEFHDQNAALFGLLCSWLPG